MRGSVTSAERICASIMLVRAASMVSDMESGSPLEEWAGYRRAVAAKQRGFFGGVYPVIAPLRLFGMGHVAEWLRSGLQIREPRFDSGRGLHPFQKVAVRLSVY